MLDWRRALYFALWCGTALTQMAEAWFHTRPVIWLVEGIPALLGALAFVAVTISFGATSRIDVVDRYDLAIDEAIRRSDYVAAELYLHKLLQIGDSQENVRYRLALVAEERGDGARANEMMAQIAPETERGHPGAHFWRAKHMLSKRQPLTLTESRQLVSHLEASLSDAADNVEAHALLGQILFSQRNFDGAIEHLTTLIKEEPQWRITLAKVYLAQGNRSAFEKELEAACSEFQRRVHNRADDMEARLWLAQAWALRGKFDEAEKALLECIQLPGVDGKRCRDGLASLYVAQFDRELPQAPPQNPPVEWLRKSLDQSPDYIDALLRLANYMNASGEAGKAARSAIKKVLAGDDVPPALLQILGAHAARDGDMAAARRYLERALAMTPHSHVVLNNLAWVLAHQPEPDLEQALKLADEAVEIAPANADVRETRGQILTKLERWPEALADLEVALGFLQGSASLHRSVATIYERLGNSSMARRHRDLADEVERARDEKTGASGDGAKATPAETDDKATKPPLAEPLPEVEPPALPSGSAPSSLGRHTTRPPDEVSSACGCSSFSLRAASHGEVEARPA